MRKPSWFLLGVIATALLAVAIYRIFLANSEYQKNYQKIAIGMSVEEIEALLGQGMVIDQKEVPAIVVAVNPADEEAARERERQRGTPSTARDYPTRIKPVVEGDRIMEWVDRRTGERILVGFKDGRVHEKNLWTPPYLDLNL